MSNTTRITVFIDLGLFNQLHAVTSEIGISKEALLSTNLPIELDYLTKLRANGPKATHWNRTISNIRVEKRRLNITLPKKSAETMQRLCKEKGITRDLFISAYISFLVDGDPAGSCAGPLVKIAAMLSDPRFEYTGQANSNPYDHLYASEEEVEKAWNILRNKGHSGSRREKSKPKK